MKFLSSFPRLRVFHLQKDWSKSNRRYYWIVQSLLPLLITFFYFIPSCNLWLSEVPSLDQLQVSQGKLFYEERRKGGILSLIEASGKHVYSCGDFGKSHCYLTGKVNQVEPHATVWWFERKVYLWFSERHLMRLMVNGQEVISYKKSFENIASDKEFDIYLTIGYLIFILFNILFIDLYAAKEFTIEQKNSHESRNC